LAVQLGVVLPVGVPGAGRVPLIRPFIGRAVLIPGAGRVPLIRPFIGRALPRPGRGVARIGPGRTRISAARHPNRSRNRTQSRRARLANGRSGKLVLRGSQAWLAWVPEGSVGRLVSPSLRPLGVRSTSVRQSGIELRPCLRPVRPSHGHHSSERMFVVKLAGSIASPSNGSPANRRRQRAPAANRKCREREQDPPKWVRSSAWSPPPS
jgi:hypothetical protein